MYPRPDDCCGGLILGYYVNLHSLYGEDIPVVKSVTIGSWTADLPCILSVHPTNLERVLTTHVQNEESAQRGPWSVVSENTVFAISL